MRWAGVRSYCLAYSIKLLRWSNSRAISFPFSCFEINSLSPLEFQLSALWLDPVTLLKTVGFLFSFSSHSLTFSSFSLLLFHLQMSWLKFRKLPAAQQKTSRALIFPLDYSINKSLLMSGYSFRYTLSACSTASPHLIPRFNSDLIHTSNCDELLTY